jgi:ketosteroid isomerase-like protein
MKIALPFILICFLGSCTVKKKTDLIDNAHEKMLLFDTDKAFSDLSVQKGMKAAFLEYIDSDGVLLKPNFLPMVGADAIDYLIQINDTSYTLNWIPRHAFVSKSADMGYTYGIYALHPNEIDTVLYGTYVSIWKKEADGKWKFVLDSGNEGVGEFEENK